MFNFDKNRFLKTQTGAVKQKDNINTIIDELLPEIDNIFFIGSGGVGILFDSTIEFARTRSAFPFQRVLAAEFIASPNKTFSSKSLVVIPSLSGTTKETLELVDFCNKKHVKTLALVGSPNTPLEKEATYTVYNDVLDDTSSESYYLQGLMIVLRVMLKKGEITTEKYDSYFQDFAKLPGELLKVKQQAEPMAKEFAQKFQDTPYHIITGAGDSFTEAYYYGMCILEEMQWIKTRPVQAADFFHGTLELVEKGVSVIVFEGEDFSRPIVDRVRHFLPEVTDTITVIDTKDYQMDISNETRKIISPIVLATILERVSAYLSDQRKHPLTVRRYYKRIPY